MSKLEGARPKSRQEFGSRMSVLLSNPDYLLEGYSEKKCKYIGVIEDMPTSYNMSDRGNLLTLLDNKRNSGKLPWTLDANHVISLTISAYNVKIMKDSKGGALLHRIPIHEIAAASYINDDHQHLVFLKAGDASAPHCPCHVLHFSKRADAEEVCTILQQTFQLVYTEATMEHFNESISAGEKGWRASRTSLVLVPRPSSPAHAGPGSPPKSATSRPAAAPAVATVTEEPVNTGTDAVQLVQEYMERLHKLLDFKELGDFATLLKQYRGDLTVQDFLEKLKTLYGEQRQFLIPDMSSFIPEEDRPAFEKFLSDNNLRSKLSPQTRPAPPAGEDRVGNDNAENFLSDQDNILTTNF